jgi:hypothetical protein
MKNIFTILALALTVGVTQAQEIEAPDFATQKTRAIKVDFFSPLTGNTTFKYEQYLKNWISLEATVGIIGLGTNIDEQYGGLAGFGIKFKKKPDYYVEGFRGGHLMQGGYVKIEGLVSVYSHNPWEVFGGQEGRTTDYAGALLLVLGKQAVLADILTLDPYIGLGYAFDSKNGGYSYAFLNGPSSFPVAASCGLTLGILLK